MDKERGNKIIVRWALIAFSIVFFFTGILPNFVADTGYMRALKLSLIWTMVIFTISFFYTSYSDIPPKDYFQLFINIIFFLFIGSFWFPIIIIALVKPVEQYSFYNTSSNVGIFVICLMCIIFLARLIGTTTLSRIFNIVSEKIDKITSPIINWVIGEKV